MQYSFHSFGDYGRVMSDFDEFLEQCHLAVVAIANGNPEPYKKLFSRREDATLANPFAPLGPVSRGWTQVSETLERAAANYANGEATGFETAAKHVSADLAYVVEVERFRAKVGGRNDFVTVALRVTTIFRREAGAWKVVHRHADTITSPRPAESVVQR